ncbi:MAG: inorganic diphosphatase [Candidatus Aenigmarchaeota archaeon]|nr:inorganic diphosphatase [Candidatus Aenigmarchaeota archaeon]MDW8149681.1 inorganic diphosphatase [Candidatus Aenigmarchaeota archaeon]
MKDLPSGPKDKFPEELFVLIEISKGSRNKYEFDKELGVLKLDRILHTSMQYPANYGFVPSTLCEDKDPLDCLVISSESISPNTLVSVRPIGLLIMEDEEGKDEKLIAVPVEKADPKMSSIRDVSDLPEALKDEIKHFFEHYKELEKGKWVKVREWISREGAIEYVVNAVKRFKEKKQ